MNILDIAQNSVRAGAALIEISLVLDTETATQVLIIQDNGSGMSEEMARNVTDPFCTTRTTRKVGLGVPFLKMAAEMTGGSFEIQSRLGAGTTVCATFVLGHIDLAPLGDMGATISVLVQANPTLDFLYTYTKNGHSFTFDTRQARELLGDVPLSEPSVALFVREYVTEHMRAIDNPEPEKEKADL